MLLAMEQDDFDWRDDDPFGLDDDPGAIGTTLDDVMSKLDDVMSTSERNLGGVLDRFRSAQSADLETLSAAIDGLRSDVQDLQASAAETSRLANAGWIFAAVVIVALLLSRL